MAHGDAVFNIVKTMMLKYPTLLVSRQDVLVYLLCGDSVGWYRNHDGYYYLSERYVDDLTYTAELKSQLANRTEPIDTATLSGAIRQWIVEHIDAVAEGVAIDSTELWSTRYGMSVFPRFTYRAGMLSSTQTFATARLEIGIENIAPEWRRALVETGEFIISSIDHLFSMSDDIPVSVSRDRLLATHTVAAVREHHAMLAKEYNDEMEVLDILSSQHRRQLTIEQQHKQLWASTYSSSMDYDEFYKATFPVVKQTMLTDMAHTVSSYYAFTHAYMNPDMSGFNRYFYDVLEEVFTKDPRISHSAMKNLRVDDVVSNVIYCMRRKNTASGAALFRDNIKGAVLDRLVSEFGS